MPDATPNPPSHPRYYIWTPNILILKTAIENFLLSKNWQHAPRKSGALLQFLVDNENVIRFDDDGKISFRGNDLSTALGKMLTMPDAREYLGVVDAA